MDTDKQAASPIDGQSRQAGMSPEAEPLSGIEINLVPSTVSVELRREQSRQEWERLRPLWHRVTPEPGALVSIWSREQQQTRRVRLTVQSSAPTWNAARVRWTYAVRRVPDIQGGPAPEAQDLLSADETELILLLLPGEQRAASLEFIARLDGETYSGDYPFDVILTDEETGATLATPGLLRLRHPNAGLLQYLPAIYSEPPPDFQESALEESHRDRFYNYRLYESMPFFVRFLRGFEDAMAPMQEMLTGIDRFFDPDRAPADCLPWLSTWVALAMDENWPELKRRRLIKEAVELYRWRGTRRGLSRYLEIYTGITPEINDQPFIGMRLGANTLLGRDTKLGDVGFHTFVVMLAVPAGQTINEQIARDIIEAEKPAHAAYELRIVQRTAVD